MAMVDAMMRCIEAEKIVMRVEDTKIMLELK
jgi:hypothetical protein